MEDFIAVSAFGVVMIILASGICFYIVQRAKSKWGSGDQTKISEFEYRIQNIEARLGDIQDIVISIDDQLKRSKQQDVMPTSRELS